MMPSELPEFDNLEQMLTAALSAAPKPPKKRGRPKGSTKKKKAAKEKKQAKLGNATTTENNATTTENEGPAVDAAKAKKTPIVRRPTAGCPPFEPSDEQRKLIENLSAVGVPIAQMSMFITNPMTKKTIAENTLRSAFAHEIVRGRVVANSHMARSLFRNGTESTDKNPFGNVTAQIFWLKARAGWNDGSFANAEDAAKQASDDLPKLSELSASEAAKIYSDFMKKT